MIIITLAGDSSRFFQFGYKTVKYKLPLGSWTVLEEIIKYLPINEEVIFVLNYRFNDKTWIRSILESSSLNNWEIVELNSTKGQLETVKLALDFLNVDNSKTLTVFNGDTVRKLYNWSIFEGDGFIEVFKSEGNHWSFVDRLGEVSCVKEKDRISDLCSSGLYYFKSAEIFLSNYDQYIKKVNKELYVAPFYQFLIDNNYLIISSETEISNFDFCGTPHEYEKTRLKYVM